MNKYNFNLKFIKMINNIINNKSKNYLINIISNIVN